MNTGHPPSDPDEETILVDLDASLAGGIASAIKWYLSAHTGPPNPTPLNGELKALATFLEDAGAEMGDTLPIPLDECA